MPGLEELFAFGTISKEFDVKGVSVRMQVLDTKQVQDALNASWGDDEVARLVEYKKQVLARSISHCNGVQYIENPGNPKQEEIKKLLADLNKFHVFIINLLYEKYDEMDESVRANLEDEVKK